MSEATDPVDGAAGPVGVQGEAPIAGAGAPGPPVGAAGAAAAGADVETLRSEVGALRERNAELEVALSHHRGFWSVRRGSTGRRLISTVLVVLALVLAPISVVTVWTKNTVTNTNQYVDTVAPLAANPAIQAAVTARVTDRVYTELDVPKLLHDTLPPRSAPLQGPMSNAIRSFISKVVSGVVASAAFQRIWTDANRVVHAQVVGALEGTSSGGVQVKNGKVELDLHTLVTTVQQKLTSAGLAAAGKIPTSRINATITLFSAPQLQHVQRLFQLLRTVGFWLPIALVVVLALGVYLSRDRRRTLVAVGFFVALGMVVLELALALARSYYLSHLPPSVRSPAAAAAAFDILLHFLKASGWALFAFGLLLGLGAYLAGPSVVARGIRTGSSSGMGHLGDQMELRGWLPSGLRAFFASTRVGWDVGLVAAAVASLVLWRGRSVGGVLLAAVLLVVAMLVVELLGRRGPSVLGREHGTSAPSGGPPLAGEAGEAAEGPPLETERAAS